MNRGRLSPSDKRRNRRVWHRPAHSPWSRDTARFARREKLGTMHPSQNSRCEQRAHGCNRAIVAHQLRITRSAVLAGQPRDEASQVRTRLFRWRKTDRTIGPARRKAVVLPGHVPPMRPDHSTPARPGRRFTLRKRPPRRSDNRSRRAVSAATVTRRHCKA